MAGKSKSTDKDPKTGQFLTKFDPKFVDIIRRLKEAGCPDVDIGFALGVHRETIGSWIKRYPDLKKAVEEGKRVAKARLIAKAMLAACGYDYEESNEKWVPTGIDKDGKPKLVLQSVSKYRRHHPPDSKMLATLLAYLEPGFRNLQTRSVDLFNQKVTLKIDGKLESKKIEELAGKLLDETSKPVVSRVLGEDSEDAQQEPVVSEEIDAGA